MAAEVRHIFMRQATTYPAILFDKLGVGVKLLLLAEAARAQRARPRASAASSSKQLSMVKRERTKCLSAIKLAVEQGAQDAHERHLRIRSAFPLCTAGAGGQSHRHDGACAIGFHAPARCCITHRSEG